MVKLTWLRGWPTRPLILKGKGNIQANNYAGGGVKAKAQNGIKLCERSDTSKCGIEFE